MKELYIEALEELADEYMDAHPDASWDEAYAACEEDAYDRMTDKYADLIDHARMVRKEQ